MKVTEKDVASVAALANLELSAEERAGMVRDLNSILGYIERLDKLDTSKVEPMAQAAYQGRNKTDELQSEPCLGSCRDDVVEGLRKSLSQEDSLKNAPDADGTFFRVPKVIER